MSKKGKLRDWYLAAAERLLKKLRYKTKPYDEKTWGIFIFEIVLLIIYHIISLFCMGIPTPVSLILNFLIVMRFIFGNHRENRKIVNKAKRNKRASKNEYTSMHAMIAIGEGIAVGLMIIMLFWLGIENNIGQKELATVVILCISFFEGWKDINVSFFDATPQTF